MLRVCQRGLTKTEISQNMNYMFSPTVPRTPLFGKKHSCPQAKTTALEGVRAGRSIGSYDLIPQVLPTCTSAGASLPACIPQWKDHI